MPENALVTLRYGPYRSCGVVEHRTFRLQGLQGRDHLPWPFCKFDLRPMVAASIKPLQKALEAVLQEDGHQVVLEEIPDWNDVQLFVNGELVFQCNINDLDFGGDGKLDPLCEEARREVLNAY